MIRCCILLILFFSYGLQAGEFPSNHFASADNPYYWKNKIPRPGYWQQDVYYHIKADMNVDSTIIDGLEMLVYTNNSPDTLHHAYFHLWQNAFQPGSYYDDAQRSGGAKPKYGKYEKQGLGIAIDGVRSNGQFLKTEFDNTIMKVFFDEPMPPNSSKTFYIKFNTYYDKGSVRRRMKTLSSYGSKQFNGAQWYPKICVYDDKFGWTTDQHLSREFYGDFGTFDVELTFPANYIVEATGELINRDQCYPDSLWYKIRLENFTDNPWDTKPSIIIGDDSTKKTWMFHAENVHDFAFIANPNFRIGEYLWYPDGDSSKKPIQCLSVVQEPHASGWKNAAELTARVLQIFSRDFGMYAYPKMIVADAEDGMEYPMLTMDGGKDPGYRYVITHEIGHNWFYGMVANNETYRASLDEGFTQFLTAWGLEALDGDKVHAEPIKNKYQKFFTDSNSVRDISMYRAYIPSAAKNEDSRINEHSDMYYLHKQYSGGYRDVYMRTATMLYNLQYVLGDSLFLNAMKHYFHQWSFCHPYPEDFRQSFIDYTKQDLNWFFDQWMETTKKINLAVVSVKREKEKGADAYAIKFKRKEEMTMPMDFSVLSKNHQLYDFYVPNTWFQKETTADTLPKWFGWNGIRPSYTAHLNIPGGIKNVIIDPSERLADKYMLNNRLRGNVKLRFDSHINNGLDWKYYKIYMRPDIWYNAVDGIKIGLHLHGNYMNYHHKLSLNVWYNSRLLQNNNFRLTDSSKKHKPFPFSYSFSWSEPLDRVSPRLSFSYDTKFLDGLWYDKLVFDKRTRKGIQYGAAFKYMRRGADSTVSSRYPLYAGEWSEAKNNSSFIFYMNYGKAYKNGGYNINANLRTTAFTKDMNYRYLDAQLNHYQRLWKFDLRSRLYGRWGSRNQAAESAVYFAQANGEAMYDNKYTRAGGIIPIAWADDFGNQIKHFQYGGGLNLRGYAGYFMSEQDEFGQSVTTYKGISGAAINAELQFDRLFGVKAPKFFKAYDIDLYLFGDAGMIQFVNSGGQKEWSELRVDAGLGSSLTIKKWWVLQNIKPLTLRFDMPLFLSHKPFAESGNHLRFRYVFGIEKAF